MNYIKEEETAKINIKENSSKNIHNVVERCLLADKDSIQVLDIPSGEGAFTYRLMNKDINVYAADIQNILKFRYDKYIRADMNEKLPFKNDELDAVVCIDGIEHLENPFHFINECNRIIRKEGKIILSTPNISAMRSRWRWFLTGHHNKCKSPLNENYPSPLHHINMMSYHRLRYILHTNGFEIIYTTTNRIKLISWFYLIFYPFAYLKTLLVYKKEEKDQQQKKVNYHILKKMYSVPVFLGEALIVKAIKKR